LKILSWNVNGLRACAKKGFLEFFAEEKPDCFCVQETKMRREQADFDFPGYFQYWNSAEKKGYSGTAVFSKTEPVSVSYGMGIQKHDGEGRMITAEYEGFYLVNVYSPNSQQDLQRLGYRMEWEEDFNRYAKRLSDKKNVVICGDLNVAHKEIDLKNPKSNVNSAGFTPAERGKMTALIESGFADAFRRLYPEKVEYTWWSYPNFGRATNTGWRIDYFLVSEPLMGSVKDVVIYGDILGSDHCPVGLTI